jgi:pimeloyl-ACP methyl ester carboxylesterase
MPKVLPSRVLPAPRRAAQRAGDDYGATAEPDWRTIDWRRHMRFFEVAGRRVNVVELGEGEGPPVVFVHGISGCWQNWLENLPRVAEERRVVALDLPGQGASEMPREEISISGFGRCVEEVCDRLDLGRVALVGNSMGGFVAAEVAIAFPERVERLVLVSAAGISTNNVRSRPVLTLGRVAAAIATQSAAQHRIVASRPGLRHYSLLLVARHPSRLRADLVYHGLMAGTGKPGFRDALRELLGYDFRDRLPGIHCPTLIVWGTKDMILPVADAKQYAKLIEGAEQFVMEDTGHVPMLERPVTFNDRLREFLAERPGQADDSSPQAVAAGADGQG